MRGKRSKQYRKLMHQYQLHFNFREPYQVLVDSQIIRDAARFKMRLGGMLSNTLHGEIKPMITQCCIRHLYNDPTDDRQAKEGWIETAKQAERRRCGHHELEEPLSELECLMSVVDPKASGTNRHRYVVAAQEMEVRRAMRAVAGVPLVYINRSVMILEPMAAKTGEVAEADEKAKIRAGLKGRRGPGDALKRKREEDEDEEGAGTDAAAATAAAAAAAGEEQVQPKKKKPKGPKGPNPLSVKKPKKETAAPGEDEHTRSVLRKASKQDPQIADKALGGDTVTEGHAATDGVEDGSRTKRKRKRKPREAGGDQNVEAAKEELAG
ncbi:hypothetical protein MBLNU230_g4676t1 [Neophaeotheca triangularis]